jgi:lipopolysaccharide/colanic/teichoic acid biosynthesis glycosyltransferase
VKRVFDILLASAGLLISSPLWIIIILRIKLEDRGPVFYLQERVGKNGKIFRVIKFRSMIIDAEKEGVPIQATEHDPRVTKIGNILRKTAMDELPQLVNIWKGDMSFVGPRALRPEEREVRGSGVSVRIEKVPGYKDRLAVIPGLTGLAQVYLPADAPRRQKFRYDALYVKRQSFCFDLKLVLLSFWITFKGKWESSGKKI